MRRAPLARTARRRRAVFTHGASLLALLAPLGLGAQATDSTRRAPAGPPATDVWVATLRVHGSSIDVGTPVNVTHRPGYDNQPAFTPDGRFVLYTSVGADGQADIWRWDRRANAVERLTSTPESEYSPTPIPGDRGFSTVRVEHDSTQRLWRFDADGRNPRLVLERVKPVGYHAWADAHTLALYVLGEPATLQLADTRTGEARHVADSIGRSLQRRPGGHTVTFMRRDRDGWRLEEVDPVTGSVRRLWDAVDGSEDFAWTPGGVMLMAGGTTLYARYPGRIADGWQQVATFSVAGLGAITRLAVSPKGDRIAFVASEQPYVPVEH